jgi:hypothetical protein
MWLKGKKQKNVVAGKNTNLRRDYTSQMMTRILNTQDIKGTIS